MREEMRGRGRKFCFVSLCLSALFSEKKNIKDVRHEFDDFWVNTHLCKLRC